jgi:hypothetical protein
LSRHHVGSSQSFYFFSLNSAIVVVKTFWPISSRSSQILISLELPITPPNLLLLTNISYLINLPSASITIHTSSKLTQKHRNS